MTPEFLKDIRECWVAKDPATVWRSTMLDLIDEVERLQKWSEERAHVLRVIAENARLREALQHVLKCDYCEKCRQVTRAALAEEGGK